LFFGISILGLTGFDSKDSGTVSMPGIEDVARKNYLQNINWRNKLRSRSLIEV
jgi:hypothetical protein